MSNRTRFPLANVWSSHPAHRFVGEACESEGGIFIPARPAWDFPAGGWSFRYSVVVEIIEGERISPVEGSSPSADYRSEFNWENPFAFLISTTTAVPKMTIRLLENPKQDGRMKSTFTFAGFATKRWAGWTWTPISQKGNEFRFRHQPSASSPPPMAPRDRIDYRSTKTPTGDQSPTVGHRRPLLPFRQLAEDRPFHLRHPRQVLRRDVEHQLGQLLDDLR